jgi:hypothetical protein
MIASRDSRGSEEEYDDSIAAWAHCPSSFTAVNDEM